MDKDEKRETDITNKRYDMILKWIFDRIVADRFVVPLACVINRMHNGESKNAGGPAFFVQKRVGKGGKLFNCHSSLQ